MWKALIKLVEKWACSHDWKEVDAVNVSSTYSGIVRAHKYLFCCNKCGSFKKVTVEI